MAEIGGDQGRLFAEDLSEVPEGALEILYAALITPRERVAVALMDGMSQLQSLAAQFREVDEFIVRIHNNGELENRLTDEAHRRVAVVGGLLQLPYLRHFDHAALNSSSKSPATRKRIEQGREALITGMTALAGALSAADFRRALAGNPIQRAINIQLEKHSNPLALHRRISEINKAATAMEAMNKIVAIDKIAEMMTTAVNTDIRVDRLKIPEIQLMLPYGGTVALPRIAERVLAIAG